MLDSVKPSTCKTNLVSSRCWIGANPRLHDNSRVSCILRMSTEPSPVGVISSSYAFSLLPAHPPQAARHARGKSGFRTSGSSWHTRRPPAFVKTGIGLASCVMARKHMDLRRVVRAGLAALQHLFNKHCIHLSLS